MVLYGHWVLFGVEYLLEAVVNGCGMEDWWAVVPSLVGGFVGE